MRPVKQLDPFDCKIVGLTFVENGRPTDSGYRVIAHFDCVVRGILFKGCSLVRTPKEGVGVWLPRFQGEKESVNHLRRSASFSDDSLQHSVMATARNVYRAMGGMEAEWVARDAN